MPKIFQCSHPSRLQRQAFSDASTLPSNDMMNVTQRRTQEDYTSCLLFLLEYSMSSIHVHRLKFADKSMIAKNVPQLVIQVLYAYLEGSFDIFVASAMIFSVLSAIISISQQIARKLKYDESAHVALHYRSKKTFKMKIECNKLMRHHKYCHETLTNSLCSVLEIDNAGNIEVYYIYSIRHGIIAYIEVSNISIDDNNAYDNNPGGHMDKDSLFAEMNRIGDNNNGDNKMHIAGNDRGDINEIFKQEFVTALGLPIADQIIGQNMKITMSEEKVGLSVDNVEIDIKLKSKSNSNKKEEKIEMMKAASEQTNEQNNNEIATDCDINNNVRSSWVQLINSEIPKMPQTQETKENVIGEQ